MIEYLVIPEHQKCFINSLKELARNPTYDNFSIFRNACNLPKGFATPITFLSFYIPDEYPMVDKIVAFWWKNNIYRFGLENAPQFHQRPSDGWIQGISDKDSIANWNAYIAWKVFCTYYKRVLTDLTQISWRARDVEMAVWESQKRCIPLEKLT